jgi:hypothetical protein
MIEKTIEQTTATATAIRPLQPIVRQRTMPSVALAGGGDELQLELVIGRTLIAQRVADLPDGAAGIGVGGWLEQRRRDGRAADHEHR